MLSPQGKEIDHHTMKLIVGLIALSLASVTNWLAEEPLTSISGSYYEGDWARNFFVGSLCAISAFLAAYNGYGPGEMISSKLAAIAAIGIAMFPCESEKDPDPSRIDAIVHAVCAAAMFIILACFCKWFRRRARDKADDSARVRSYIYSFCGVAIVLVILVLAADYATGGVVSRALNTTRLTYYGEEIGLIAFGLAWLVASQILPISTALTPVYVRLKKRTEVKE